MRPNLRTFVSVGVFCVIVFFLSRGILAVSAFINTTGLSPYAAFALAFGDGVDLGAIDHRINILFPSKTSLDVLSFSETVPALSVIAVPTDIWSETLKDTVGTAYGTGEQKEKGGGLILTKAIVSDMTGLPVQYGMVTVGTKTPVDYLRALGERCTLFSRGTCGQTDMNTAELLTVLKLFSRVSSKNISDISFADMLYAPPENWYGKKVELPKESFTAIHEFISQSLK